jgi:hypothetical protein
LSLAAGIGVLLGLAAGPCRSQAPGKPALEYQVEAAFLLNFTRFVEWPSAAFASDKSPITICILGPDPFGRELDRMLEGEAVNARKIVAERVQRIPGPQVCQVLFLSEEARGAAELLPGVTPGVLTVGEGDGFLRDSGMIAFVLDNRRVRFDINEAAAKRAGLRMSAKLLSVARSVAE